MAPKTYSGNCHCGAIKFNVVLPIPIEEMGLNACDCSICTKKGYLFVFVRKANVTFTKGAGTDGLGGGILVDYRFNSRMVCHRFCGRCGTPFGVVRPHMGASEGFALNARMLMGVDLWSLDVEKFSGGAPWRPYNVPTYPKLKELLAQPLEDGEKIYHGSCHCGAVTFALKSPWSLDKAGPEGVENNHVQECDCSTCIRSAGMFTYPRPLNRVSIHTTSPDAITTYVSPVGKGFGGEQFCSTCGVPLFQQLIGPPSEKVASAPAEVQAKIREKLDCKPVHVRALDVAMAVNKADQAEWERIKSVCKRERGSLVGEPYVVPE